MRGGKGIEGKERVSWRSRRDQDKQGECAPAKLETRVP